jgi:hypothetical protein
MEQERVAIADLAGIIDRAVSAKHWLKKMA